MLRYLIFSKDAISLVTNLTFSIFCRKIQSFKEKNENINPKGTLIPGRRRRRCRQFLNTAIVHHVICFGKEEVPCNSIQSWTCLNVLFVKYFYCIKHMIPNNCICLVILFIYIYIYPTIFSSSIRTGLYTNT